MSGHAKTELSAIQAMEELVRYQPHTFTGERGKAVVTVQVGHVYEAVLRAMMETTGSLDIDHVDLEGVDPVAIAQNTCVAIEKQVGIYPNIPGRQ